MLVSGTRLLHSAIRLSDVAFPASDTLIARTRLIYLHLDNLLSFAKRDRDGKVDAYFLGYLPDELILLFFQRGELVTAAGIGSGQRTVLPIAEAVVTGLRAGTSLLLYPTKALAQDQLRSFGQLAVPGLVAGAYDGDASREERSWARANANVVLTNPEMLHHDLLYALRDIAHVRLTRPLTTVLSLRTSPRAEGSRPDAPQAASNNEG